MTNARHGLLAGVVAIASAVCVPSAMADWGGFYVGLSGGAGWADGDVSYVPPSSITAGPFSYSLDGVVGGGFAGWQMQSGSFVFGVEGSFRGGDLDGNTSCNVGNNDICEFDLNHIWTAGGRVGWATPTVLIFVSGGYAEASFDVTRHVFPPAINLNPSFGTFDHSGYMIGGGLEWMLSDHVVAGVEYQHISLDATTERVVRNDGGFAVLESDPNMDIAQARLAYKF